MPLSRAASKTAKSAAKAASKSLPTVGPVLFPKQFPNAWVLKQIAFPPPKAYFQPQSNIDGQPRPPRISGRNQERIREVCLIAGIDPVKVVGLPETPVTVGAAENVKGDEKVDAMESLPRGSKRVLDKYEREKKIEDNMAKMQERIAKWREEKRKLKEKNRPDMPF
ncbi:hypothetical protein HK102_002847 [Quaeritorhiza haematococci]|nr:hypothetical protein HK102_002847 [Quaeritorhiza haematococci]